MSYYAKVVNGIVTKVLKADIEFINTFEDGTPGEWIQTSYNTRGNVHYLPNSNTPSGQPPLRGNFAGPGSIYDKENDVFYSPKPYPSWTLDTNIWNWKPPIPCPFHEGGPLYIWDESIQNWVAQE